MRRTGAAAHFLLGALFAGGVLLPAYAAGAQPLPIITREVRQRWLASPTDSALKDWLSFETTLTLDSTRMVSTVRNYFFEASLDRFNVADVIVSVDSDGAGARITGARRIPPGDFPDPPGGVPIGVPEYFKRGNLLELPASTAWDVVPAVHPRSFARGARWQDSVHLFATWHGSTQTLTGIRTSEIIGDTIFNGRRAWQIRDVLLATYTDTMVELDPNTAALTVTIRQMSGAIHGEFLWDSVSHLCFARVDTTSLAGTASARTGDNQSFSAPIRFERVRSFRSWEPAAYAAHLAARQAKLPSEYAHPWLPSDTGWVAKLKAGDTVDVIAELSNRLLSQPVDTVELRLLLPLMNNPSHAFASGVVDLPYGNLIESLVEFAIGVDAHDQRRGCKPAACALLEQQWEVSTNPQLRDVGLVAKLVADPARWSDTVLVRARAGDQLLSRAANLAMGAWSASAVPMPLPGATWSDWIEWILGRAVGPTELQDPPELPLSADHLRAIHFFEAETGRDLTSEWKHTITTVQDDSTGYVLDALLDLRGAWTPSSSDRQLTDQIRVGGVWKYARAMRAINFELKQANGLHDDSTDAAVLDVLLSFSLGHGRLWPAFAPSWDATWQERSRVAETMWQRHWDAGGPRPPTIFVRAATIPIGVARRWKGAVEWVTDTAWVPPPDRYPAWLIDVHRVQHVGPFIRVEWERRTFLTRQTTFDLGYSRGEYVLMHSEAGWTIVSWPPY